MGLKSLLCDIIVQLVTLINHIFSKIIVFWPSFQTIRCLFMSICPCVAGHMPITQMHDKTCRRGFSNGKKISIYVLWVFEHNSHVAYGWSCSYVRKQANIKDHPTCT